MNKLRLITIGLFTLILGFSTIAFAQPRVGEKIPEFELQGTDGEMYGVKYSDKRVSIISIIGYS